MKTKMFQYCKPRFPNIQTSRAHFLAELNRGISALLAFNCYNDVFTMGIDYAYSMNF